MENEEKNQPPWSMEKKKWKKWAKKIEKGDVQSAQTYQICRYKFQLTGIPSLKYVTDKTREKSEHNLLVSELRNFILSIYYHDQPILKGFEVKNRGYIRYIIHLHISDLEEGLSELQLNQPIYTMKVSKSTEEISYLPEKLLTIPFQECAPEELMLNPSVEVAKMTFSSLSSTDTPANEMEVLWRQLHAYLPNASILQLYNFPMLSKTNNHNSPKSKQLKITETIEDLRFTDLEKSPLNEPLQNTEPAAQLDQIGLELLPSMNEIRSLQNNGYFPSFQAAEYFQDFPKNTIAIQNDSFIKTIDYPSKQYDQLWNDNDTSSSFKPLLLVAIDCEMCETAAGVEVTRVTVVNHDEEVLLDVLVKPENPIINYRTQYSGITETMMKSISTKLIQVQLLLCRWIVSKTIIIGHSLENDLRALQLLHYNVVDTTFLYPHPTGFPYRNKLKFLAKEYLKIDIQLASSVAQGSKKKKHRSNGQGINQPPLGHDSAEDAITALQLVKLKLLKGPLFGLNNPEDIRIPITKRLAYLKVPSLLLDFHPPLQEPSPTIGDTNIDHDTVASPDSGSQLLELLASNQTIIKKYDNLEEISQTIHQFVLHNQNEKNPINPPHLSTEEPQVSEEAHGKRKLSDIIESTEIDSIPKQDIELEGDKQHFIYLTIPASSNGESNISRIQFFLSTLQQSLGVGTESKIQTHGLCILTSQKSLSRSYSLQEKKKKVYNFQQRMTSLTWTREEEQELKERNKITGLGQVSFLIL